MALRPTSIILGSVIIAAVLGAWWWTRAIPTDAGPLDRHPSRILAPASTVPSPDDRPATGSAPATSPANVQASVQATITASGAATLPAPATGTPAVARALSAEGERRVDKFLAGLRTASSDAKDYETLGRSEPADPDWSPRLETLIEQMIERHAREFGHLEISKPRCSRSLCMLTAVATTRNPPQLAQADFQRLVGYMMQEPWFRESFFDASTTMAADATGDVFVSYFIRK